MASRASGILLHPTSLPGPHGNGDFGPWARRFLEALATGGQSVWQLLPLGPTDGGLTGGPGSPYDCRSAFAGSGRLISPEELVRDGLLEEAAASGSVGSGSRRHLLQESWRRFSHSPPEGIAEQYQAFVEAPERRFWLDDWTLFAVLHDHFAQSWLDWPEPLRCREPGALSEARDRWSDEIAFERWVQFLFHHQWRELRATATELGIRVCGDMPIYVSLDSADVWSSPELFELDATGQPTAVGGTPDYFSSTGQRWGNPLYRWQRHREEGFDWWSRRVGIHLEMFDLLRLDHFRGFAQYWAVPAEEATAEGGSWQPGPGRELFDALEAALGPHPLNALPFIAEDLGHITPDVRELRRWLGLPGMKILQFAFSMSDSEHLPHNYTPDTVAYTGTHDNDTTRGWYESLGEEERGRVTDYLGLPRDVESWAVPRHMIRCALESVADLAIVPLQDVLCLGGEARFNTPSTIEGNWSWRVWEEALAELDLAWLHRLTELSGRLPKTDDVDSDVTAESEPPEEESPR